MNWNKLALGGAVVGSVAAMGCGESNTMTTMADAYTAPDAFMMTMPPVSVVYAVDTISIPEMPTGPMSNMAPGFNLDDKVSDGTTVGNCEDVAVDFVNASGETGVDNQLVGALIGLLSGFISDLDVQAEIEDQISSGALILAVRVNDINSFENDPSVTLDLFLVNPQGCAMAPCMPMGGSVMSGATWEMGNPLASGLAASITGGRLVGGPLDLPLSFEASGMQIDLVIRDARVGGDISATAMANGNIGGELRIDDVVMLAERIMPGIGDIARPLLEDNADVSPGSDPNICQSISAGIAFTAVQGELE